jgi:hypothetical protein
MNAPNKGSSREREAEMLKRCVAAARGLLQAAQDQREANVFRVAGSVLRSRFLAESTRLKTVSQNYFAQHPDELLRGENVVRKGWVISLPRLRDMLSQLLKNL